MSSAQYYEGIGRRKAASARVRLFPGGSGKITVNEKTVAEHLPREGDVNILMEPLIAIGQERSYDITVHVNGGGVSGQRDAIKLGIARALLLIDPDTRGTLKAGGWLTRDARIKERKKPGLKRARKAPTFTKR
jgi:small subunit ribosomal protein S9